jgi:hypothetical protein
VIGHALDVDANGACTDREAHIGINRDGARLPGVSILKADLERFEKLRLRPVSPEPGRGPPTFVRRTAAAWEFFETKPFKAGRLLGIRQPGRLWISARGFWGHGVDFTSH